MRMSPPIEYDPPLFIASVLIAIVASLAALWIAFQLRRKYSALAIVAKLGSALVMGLAITGMHYTGMAAARFAPGSICLAADSTGGMENATLAVIIGIVTVSILIVTRPVLVGPHELDISCSIGISMYPADGKDIGSLMANADVAMYHAKKGGRNSCRYFAPELSAEKMGSEHCCPVNSGIDSVGYRT